LLKSIRIVLLATILSAFAGPTLAAGGNGYSTNTYTPPLSTKNETYGQTMGRKLGAGFSNIGLGFFELPKNVINTTNEVNMAAGTTLGVAKGLIFMCGRAMAGVIDVLTFPLPTEPITTPVYVWEKLDTDTRWNPIFKMKK
jgi:putative exosortase-associated protein (TIGR04073 family)